uniref:S1-RNase n=1 Tax=Antirrhinum hispanicum TaxID=49039 RepID=I7IG64_ANTHI|nr:S1-RNase [Antirrhinum hispanicum]
MANARKRDFFSLILLIVLLSDSYTTTAVEFELLKLVLQWPNSYCSLSKRPCRRKPLPSDFTIHGLWPDNRSWPLYNCQFDFDIPEVGDQKFRQKLDVIWPDLRLKRKRDPEQGFWITEWKRHGSCALPDISFIDYFTTATRLNKKFNIRDILGRGKLYPGDSYDLQQVESTLTKFIKKVTVVKCPNGFLTEVIVCFDPSGTSIIDCPGPYPCTYVTVNFPKAVKR